MVGQSGSFHVISPDGPRTLIGLRFSLFSLFLVHLNEKLLSLSSVYANSFWDMAIFIFWLGAQISYKMAAVKFNTAVSSLIISKSNVITQKPEFFYTVKLVGRDHKYSKIHVIIFTSNLIFTKAFQVWKKIDPALQYSQTRESKKKSHLDQLQTPNYFSYNCYFLVALLYISTSTAVNH